jgi:hypothetical protein
MTGQRRVIVKSSEVSLYIQTGYFLYLPVEQPAE